MQHNSWSKGASLPSAIFVFGNMVYIVWSSSLLTASKVSFGWCLSKQSCSSFILMAERELSVFALTDWHSSASAFSAGAECPPPLAWAQQASRHANRGPRCAALMHKRLPVLPLLNHAPEFCVLTSQSCLWFCPACPVGLARWKQNSRSTSLRKGMPFAVISVCNLSKAAGHGKGACTGAIREGKNLESLEAWKVCNWEMSMGACSGNSSGQLEGGRHVSLAF